MSKVIIFSRVSTDKQTLEQQTETLIAEGIKMGYSKEDMLIIEDHESAISLDEQERHGLNIMKEYIENYDVNCVIAWEVSRVSRRPKVLYSIRDYLIERKIQLVILTPYMRLLDNDGKMSQSANLLFSLFTSLSESEMMIKKERMSRGKRKKMSENIYCGTKPVFGYKVDETRHIVIDENNAEIVKKIFNMYIAGKSVQKIALELYETGEIPFSSPESCLTNVGKILRNKVYYGENGNSYYNYPAIISKELFDKRTEEAKKHFCGNKTVGNIYYCKGLIYNGKNNRRLSTNGTSAVYRSYKLNTNDEIAIGINAIDSLVWEVVSEWIVYHAPQDNEKYKTELSDAIKTLNNKINTADKNKKDLYKQIERIEKRIIEGRLTDARGNYMEDEINNQLKEISANVEKWRNEIINKETELRNMADNIYYISQVNALNDEEKYELIKKTIGKIIVWKTSTRGTYDIDMQFKNGIIKSFTAKTQSKYPTFYDEYGEPYTVNVVKRIIRR